MLGITIASSISNISPPRFVLISQNLFKFGNTYLNVVMWVALLDLLLKSIYAIYNSFHVYIYVIIHFLRHYQPIQNFN